MVDAFITVGAVIDEVLLHGFTGDLDPGMGIELLNGDKTEAFAREGFGFFEDEAGCGEEIV